MYMGCPKALQNLALASDSIIGIIGTIVSNFLIALSIINAFSSIWFRTTEGFSRTLER